LLLPPSDSSLKRWEYARSTALSGRASRLCDEGGMKMWRKVNKKALGLNPYLWQITLIMVVCSLIYYLPVLAGTAGWAAYGALAGFHNLYGIDFYVIMFFIPVVYAAYVLGIKWTIIVAFLATLAIIPYAILIDPYPNVLLKPAAFAIILSAVGAVVAMLQKSDQQRQRSMQELKCLYDIGKAAEESDSIDQFLSAAAGLISAAMEPPPETSVRITLRDSTFLSPGFAESPHRVREELVVGGEVAGGIEIYFTHGNPYLKKQSHLLKTIAERIGGAVRQIELEHSLNAYYEQLEEMVEKRTRELEQVQEKLIRSERLAAVGELASGVGHELRNPLNVMRNCVYLLNMSLADRQDEEAVNTLKIMDKQVDIANRIVTDLLDFTRIKAPSLATVDLNNLVQESLSWVTLPERTAVITNLDSRAPQVRVDAEQVGRAFANIIANAAQAMNGNGELKISSGIEDGLAWVTFTDNGCGIPEENLEKIFEPLFTTKARGIGLGLAITKRLIEQNQGTIAVASQVKQGTTFTIRLPHKTPKKGSEH